MEPEKLTILRGRLDGKQRNRLKRLLDMDYKPSELAIEIGFDTEQIYKVYIPLNCPHIRDQKGYLLINGLEFRNWYLDTYPKTKINNDEAFCKTCRKAVTISNPIKQTKKNTEYLTFDCPNCGRKVSKIINCFKGVHEQDQ
jgi:hypothetical protein